jgi:hypothetical protein
VGGEMAIKMPLLRSLVACFGAVNYKGFALTEPGCATQISRFKVKGSSLGVEFDILHIDSDVF